MCTSSSKIIGSAILLFALVLRGTVLLNLGDFVATTTLSVHNNTPTPGKERAKNMLLNASSSDDDDRERIVATAEERGNQEESIHSANEDKALNGIANRNSISSTNQDEQTDAEQQNEDEEESLQSSKKSNRADAMVHADKYHILHNVCIQAENDDNFLVSMEQTRRSYDHTTDMIRYSVFSDNDFKELTLRVVPSDSEKNVTHYQPGTTMLTSHHTPHNNFHLHNDLLLPVFRAHSLFNVTRLLLLRGCMSCWHKRLPLMHHVLNTMGLSVNAGTLWYPAQDVLGPKTQGDDRNCYERVVIERQGKGNPKPYYTHPDRFSPRWPQHLFFDYRDQVHESIKSLNKTQIGVQLETNHSKPVLTWMSRGISASHNARQITNEPEVVDELSKYFSVNLVDFSRRKRTTMQQSLVVVAETNVLIGLHGAGLGYTALLPNNSMLVELKNAFGPEKKIFLNMASQLNIPYYAAHLDLPNETNKNTVRSIPRFARQIYDAWIYHDKQEEEAAFTGMCLFPRHVQPRGWLSSTTASRCYLEQHKETNVWWQFSVFGELG